MLNAAVFPEPVLAWANTSLPSNANGIARSCIGVGFDQPSLEIAFKITERHFFLVNNTNKSALVKDK